MKLRKNQGNNEYRRFKPQNIFFVLLILIALFIFPLLIQHDPFFGDIVVTTFLFAALAAAWNITGGFAGQVSIGHTIFFGIGAYTSTILFTKFGISPWFGIILGAILAVCFAIFIGLPCFRLRSHFFVIATISLAEVLRRISSYWSSLTGGGKGILIDFNSDWKSLMFLNKTPYIYLTLILMLTVISITYYIKKSKLGYYLVSLREDQDAAESLGINTSKYKLIAFMISAFFTAIGGSLYAQYLLYIDPTTVFNLSLSIQLVLLSIIGGLGTVLGPVIGSFLLTPLDVLLRDWFSGLIGFNYIVYALILMIAVIYFPKGLINLFYVLGRYIMKKQSKGKEAILEIQEKRSLIKDESETIKETQKKLILHDEQYWFFNDSSQKGKEILEVKGLSKNFKGLTAVNNVDFNIRKGEILGLIGPNGAGKTTIFNLITGFIPPDKGIIKFKGKNITRVHPPYKICTEHISRTFQIVKPFGNMTVLDNVMVGGFIHSNNTFQVMSEAKDIINFIGLKRHQDNLAASLPIADRKRLELARALATHPELLLLDETMAGLNSTETQVIIELVKKINNYGITLFIIEHVMKAIMALSDRIIVLHHGEKLMEGKPEEVSKNQKVIDAYLGEAYNA